MDDVEEVSELWKTKRKRMWNDGRTIALIITTYSLYLQYLVGGSKSWQDVIVDPSSTGVETEEKSSVAS